MVELPRSLLKLLRFYVGGLLIVALVTQVPAPTAAQVAQTASASIAWEQPTVRVKELARIDAVRDNQLSGLGLVIGLNGTGDGRGAQANVQMVANMLERFGITVSAHDLRLRNVAAVMVTATLPAFAREGDVIDVTVSSFGDARSLQGGFLLQTPLTAANGDVYAVAQGPVSIGGLNVRSGGARVQENHPVVGRVANGAIVERSVPINLAEGGTLTWVLREPDFATAARVADAINALTGEEVARAVDQSAITVRVPEAMRSDPIPFIARVEEIAIQPDATAKIVINERTGTVVLGHDVRIATVAVAHGGISVRVEPKVEVSQPPPFSNGQTVITRSAQVTVTESPGRLMVLETGASVHDLVEALNSVGATPRDVVAILQAIKSAGALYGVLEVM